MQCFAGPQRYANSHPAKSQCEPSYYKWLALCKGAVYPREVFPYCMVETYQTTNLPSKYKWLAFLAQGGYRSRLGLSLLYGGNLTGPQKLPSKYKWLASWSLACRKSVIGSCLFHKRIVEREFILFSEIFFTHKYFRRFFKNSSFALSYLSTAIPC